MSGWIKLHRSLLEWEWYDDANVMRLFLHCLLKANHKDKMWRGVLIKRGTFITGLEVLSLETGLSLSKIRTALSKLESTGEIASKKTNKGTTINLMKYDIYQSSDDADDKPIANQMTNQSQTRSQTDRKQIATTKNDKNEKEVKNTTPERAEKPKFIPPTIQEFIAYMQKALPEINPEWTPERITRACNVQFDTYVDQAWHTGGPKPRKIKIWGTTAKNSMKHLKPWNFGSAPKQQMPLPSNVSEYMGD